MSGSARGISARSIIVPVAVVAVAALLIGLVIWSNVSGDTDSGDSSAAAEQGGVQPEGPDSVGSPDDPDLSGIVERDEDDVLTAGPVDAPVGMVMFTDYQCPYCAQWTQDTLPSMLEYAEDGDLRIEIRDVNIYGEDSERAARASYAAGLQDAYWDYHDSLFAGGEIRTGGELGEDSLVSLADELGLDTEQFRSDMNSSETEETVTQNAQMGTDLGVFSTPAFVLNGDPIMGAMPTNVFEEAVDDALAEAN